MRALILERSLTGFALSVCFGLYLFHFYLIWKYAVDVPYMDDWASFESNQLPSGLSLEGLFAQHNEHRITTTRLFVWLQFHLNGWNLAIHQLLNFAIYGFVLVAIGWFAKGAAPQIPVWLILSFSVFLLSPINRSNHLWGYQTNIHFWLFFYVVSVMFLFREKLAWMNLTLGTVAAILSTYSMAGGFVSSLVLLVMTGIFQVMRMHSSPESPLYRRSYLQLIGVLGFLGATTLLWLVDYRRPLYHPPLTFPDQWRFWSHYLNVISLGFGIDEVSSMLGAFYIFIVLVPVLGVILIHKRRLPVGQWRTLTVTLGFLGVLASVSAGRAGFGVEQAKDSRYFELSMLLVLLSVVNWAFFLHDRKYLKAVVLVGLWILCFLGFWNNWKDFRYYKREAVQRNVGIKCLTAYYDGNGDGLCPTIFPVPIPSRLLRQASALNVSFYRNITVLSAKDKAK